MYRCLQLVLCWSHRCHSSGDVQFWVGLLLAIQYAVDVLLRDRPPSVYQSLILWLGLRFRNAGDVQVRIVFLSARRGSVDFLFVASLRADS